MNQGHILLGLLVGVAVGLILLTIASGDLSHTCNLGQAC